MFCYKNNQLVLSQGDKDINIEEIAKKEPNPFYLYDLFELRDWYRFFVSTTEKRLKVFFAMKSNSNKEILRVFREEGAGVDVVSLGESLKALDLGFKPQQIIFSGVGKSKEELSLAVEKSFFQINVESFEELKRLSEICQEKKKHANIGLRINPNVDFESHPYIKTGLKGHKFGLEEEQIPEILNFLGKESFIKLKGLSMHIGSQIFSSDPFLKAISYLKNLYDQHKNDGWPLEVLDIGGGFGVDYEKSGLEEEKTRLRNFNEELKKLFHSFPDQIITEPGRFLTARFGLLCAKVEYIKHSPDKKFIILNSGMNHFLRPALYKAKHRILALKKASTKDYYDVVGPICETGDSFAENYYLDSPKQGDFLAILDAGAYGFVMSNSYNLGLPVKEICFDKGQRI